MSALTLTSSLLSWEQLSEPLRQQLQGSGFEAGSWLVKWVPDEPHAIPTGGPPLSPWAYEGFDGANSGDPIVWREVQDFFGETLARGHGAASHKDLLPPGAHCREWRVPKKLRALEALRGSQCSPQGMDEEGRPCQTGPFWVVQAPALTEALTPEEGRLLQDDCPERQRAQSFLVATARHEKRLLARSEVDVLELFAPSSLRTTSTTSGLVFPGQGEHFLLQGGWDPGRGAHRERLRDFIDHKRPAFLR